MTEDKKQTTEENNQHIRMQRTKEGTLFEVITVVLVALLWGLAIVNYKRLPELVPTHFNLTGEADRLGSKVIVLIMAGLGTLIAALSLASAYRPDKTIRLPFAIKRATQYPLMARMTRCLAVACTLLFIGIVAKISGYSSGTFLYMGAVLLVIGVCVFFSVQIYKSGK